MDLARVSMIYSVVALYFLIPAEKLLRKFFGFDNAGTLSAAGSFAGGALFSSMIGKLNRPKPPAPKDEEDKAKNQRKNTSSRLVNADKAILGDAANVNVDEVNEQGGNGGGNVRTTSDNGGGTSGGSLSNTRADQLPGQTMLGDVFRDDGGRRVFRRWTNWSSAETATFANRRFTEMTQIYQQD